jgi:hypothetical protein
MFRSVEGKFKYNTAHSGLIINNNLLSNKSKINNDKSSFKVYYVRNLDKNQTVLAATKLELNSLPTLEKLSEQTNKSYTKSQTYQNIPVLKKYYDVGYLGYLYKGENNTGQNTLYMLYKESDTVPNYQHKLDVNIGTEKLLNTYKKLRILVVINDKESSQPLSRITTSIQNDPYKKVTEIISRLLGIVSNNNKTNIIKPLQKIGNALSPDNKIYPIYLPIDKNALLQITLLDDIMYIGIYVKLIDKSDPYGLIIKNADKINFIPVSELRYTNRANYNSITWESINSIIDIENIIYIYGYSEPTDQNIQSLTKRITSCLAGKKDNNYSIDSIGKAIYSKRPTMNIVFSETVTINSLPFISSNDIKQPEQKYGSTLTQPGAAQNIHLIMTRINSCPTYNNANNQTLNLLTNQVGILYSDNAGQKTILYTQNRELKEMPLSKFAEMATTEKPVKYVLVSRL